MSEQSPRERIAILGGGTGSIAAAFALTDSPELRARYEVTIYQLGWRIGGKGASGVNRERSDRIEEHGIHTWFGCYENAFAAMQRCYQELGRPPGTPLATWREAFEPSDHFVLSERFRDRWVDWPITFPTNDSLPGGGTLLPTFWDMVSEALQWLTELWEDLLGERPELLARPEGERHPSADHPRWDELVKEAGGALAHAEHAAEHLLLELATKLAAARRGSVDPEDRDPRFGPVCSLLQDFKERLWKRIVEPRIDDDGLREFFILSDTGIAVFCGIAADELLVEGFMSVDDEEFSDWLRRHGAREEPTIRSGPPVVALYDIPFAYQDGDPQKRNAAAGTLVSILLRMALTYKGAITWRMQAGMGDTVFGPYYEVLSRRGVRFEFFHAVTRLGLSADKRLVEEVEVVPQVELCAESYEPQVDVKGLPCWPSEPLWEQLVDGEALKARGVNFEWEVNPLDREPRCLRLGADFDKVILGISIAGLPAICGELIEQDERWQAMVRNVKTVMTQAFQIWMNRDLEQLGWRHADDALSLTYTEPLGSCWNMDQLLQRETWPARDHLRNIAYWCGVLQDEPGESQERADERAKASALAFLRERVGHLYPQAVGPDGALDWSALIDPEDRAGAARFDAQYWRANFQPSERYVLSVAGSTKHRIRAGESGFDNLYLAGDWVQVGPFDMGCIEAATMGGLQAARAICGHPRVIVGEEDPWI